MTNQTYYCGTGRRKTSVAQVRLVPGEGTIMVNGKPMEEFFPNIRLRQAVLEPLVVTDNMGKFNVTVKVNGGGMSGQAGALRHGIARALAQFNEQLRPPLRGKGLLTRDPRVKERKKYGLKRARKAKQYTKR